MLGSHKVTVSVRVRWWVWYFNFFSFFFIFFFEEGGVYFLPLYIVLNFYSKIWISFIGVMNSCKFKSFCSNNINFYLLILISTPWKFCSCSQEMKSTIVFFFFFLFGTFRCFRVLSTFYCLQSGSDWDICLAISTISITLA